MCPGLRVIRSTRTAALTAVSAHEDADLSKTGASRWPRQPRHRKRWPDSQRNEIRFELSAKLDRRPSLRTPCPSSSATPAPGYAAVDRKFSIAAMRVSYDRSLRAHPAVVHHHGEGGSTIGGLMDTIGVLTNSPTAYGSAWGPGARNSSIPDLSPAALRTIPRSLSRPRSPTMYSAGWACDSATNFARSG